MTPKITSLQPEAIPALQFLQDQQLPPQVRARLDHDLQDSARGHGRQAILAWRGDVVAGCAGWVTLGIAADGCAYGSPVVAADVEVAESLIMAVSEKVRSSGARRLRISAHASEFAKHEALKAAGFTPLFEFASFALRLPLANPSELPAGLHAVHFDQIDWSQMRACYAETFADVPNSPVPEINVIREEWSEGDRQAGRILADETGEYQAFSLICGNSVEAVGVRSGWRGRNLAATLYHIAAAALTARGCSEMRALVASTNMASMRLHQKLGFSEIATRRTVYEIGL
ncbi:GNAT family N-acetyltransferase [Collimonas antrihumi]|uniref:GNAT family N-acetyltransferase n=1 Tax=Collimonas antrihumi TaxID=1940615 RepID=UPI001B8B8E8D|nr:GNAT family N-acetyltransferase [Collimonas antrihumi]